MGHFIIDDLIWNAIWEGITYWAICLWVYTLVVSADNTPLCFCRRHSGITLFNAAWIFSPAFSFQVSVRDRFYGLNFSSRMSIILGFSFNPRFQFSTTFTSLLPLNNIGTMLIIPELFPPLMNPNPAQNFS
jgi:hypothetical protein